MFANRILKIFGVGEPATHSGEIHPQTPPSDSFVSNPSQPGTQKTVTHAELLNNPTVRLAVLTSGSTNSAGNVAQELLNHVTVDLEKKPSRILSVLNRAKALADDPLVMKIYEKCDYLRQLFIRVQTKEFSNQQELRDEVYANFKNITGVLGFREEAKVLSIAISFYPETSWIKSLARHYARITGTTEPDATMQFAAYFTYPSAARPETIKTLDAFMGVLNQLAPSR